MDNNIKYITNEEFLSKITATWESLDYLEDEERFGAFADWIEGFALAGYRIKKEERA